MLRQKKCWAKIRGRIRAQKEGVLGTQGIVHCGRPTNPIRRFQNSHRRLRRRPFQNSHRRLRRRPCQNSHRPVPDSHRRLRRRPFQECDGGTSCAEGTVLPTGVSVGYYSADADGNPTSSIPVAQLPCNDGQYGEGGLGSCEECGENEISRSVLALLATRVVLSKRAVGRASTRGARHGQTGPKGAKKGRFRALPRRNARNSPPK